MVQSFCIGQRICFPSFMACAPHPKADTTTLSFTSMLICRLGHRQQHGRLKLKLQNVSQYQILGGNRHLAPTQTTKGCMQSVYRPNQLRGMHSEGGAIICVVLRICFPLLTLLYVACTPHPEANTTGSSMLTCVLLAVLRTCSSES